MSKLQKQLETCTFSCAVIAIMELKSISPEALNKQADGLTVNEIKKLKKQLERFTQAAQKTLDSLLEA